MAQKYNQKLSPDPGSARRFKIRSVFYFALALLFVLAVVTYSPLDNDILSGGVEKMPANYVGSLGAHLARGLFLCFGLGTYVFLVLVCFGAVRALLPGPANRKRFLAGAVMMLFGAILLFALSPETFASVCAALGLGRTDVPDSCLSGGVLGQKFAGPRVGALYEGWLRRLLGTVGAMITGWTFLTAGMIMIYLADFHQFVRRAAGGIPPVTDLLTRSSASAGREEKEPAAAAGVVSEPEPAAAKQPEPAVEPVEPAKPASKPAVSRIDQLRAAMAGNGPAPEPENPVPAAVPEPVEPAGPVPPVQPASAPSAKPVSVTVPELDTQVTVSGKAVVPQAQSAYTLPHIFQLGKGVESSGEDPEEIRDKKERLQQTMDSFGVSGSVQGHISGPRITRYEIKLDQGVPVSKVTRIEDNIKMDLSAVSIRILAPIPGRSVVGVEIPNRQPEAVFMRSVMESPEWTSSKAEIPIVLGKDVAGKASILDLAKAPHLLIAGSTGSGKSVCMNTLIMSLLFRFSPEELQLILVDPKVVEMADYQTLPHLITPVINDSKKVPIALRWAVNEMEKRYRQLAKAGVKKLADYNSRPVSNAAPILDDDGLPLPDRIPLLVVIVDELADLMMTDAKSDVETSIARIAQKGRAAGIHIVIATQRPSTNIITGVIKANLPTKIAFKVSSGIDSRVILDKMGAEMLLGRGDMLFIPPGSSDLERIQGAMVDDKDIKEIVAYVSKQRSQSFNQQVVAEESELDDTSGDIPDYAPKAEYSGEMFDDEDDFPAEISPIISKYLQPGDNELMAKALEIIIMERKVSISYLQRRLTIGYNTAAKLIDELEKRNVISGPLPGGSKREILITDGLGME